MSADPKPSTLQQSSMPIISPQDLTTFTAHLKSSDRILALLGAGLSASSGLPTFRGAGGLWRAHDAVSLATPQAFAANPGLVWQFYSYRRHMALSVQPNPAHVALSKLAQHLNRDRAPGHEKFLCLSQNVDGLSQRVGHTEKTGLRLLHGSLWDIKCSNPNCDYIQKDDFTDPIVPALAIDPEHPDISNPSTPLTSIPPSSLPHCPKCITSLLRPGVVWFGESLPEDTIENIDTWLHNPPMPPRKNRAPISPEEARHVDLMLVIGTSSVVYPAAGYTYKAQGLGARVAIINLDDDTVEDIGPENWMFKGDAAVIVPQILQGLLDEYD